jgi:hypothetical protein
MRCPTAFAATQSIVPSFSDADWAFADGLTDEEAYLVDTPSCLDIPADVASVWSAAVAQLWLLSCRPAATPLLMTQLFL